MSTTILQPELAAKQKERSLSSVKAFRNDERGVVAMIFGLLFIPLLMAIGLAVDVARWVQSKNESQSVVDAMALAAGRAAQMATNGAEAAAELAAQNYFAASKPKSLLGGQVAVTPKNAGTSFDIVVTGWIRTPFMSVANVGGGSNASPAAAAAGCPAGNGFACMKVEAKASSILAAGGNNGSNVEVSMMLDVTGSMGPGYGDGKKMQDLIAAAKDAVDILVWADQSKYTSKVSLAAFSERVNVGTYAAAVTGLNATSGSSKLRPCVTERLGTHAYTDEAPGTGKWIGNYKGNTGSNNYNSSGTCGSDNPSATEALVPLTKDKDVLKAQIEALTPNGGTAGHLGTAWAWYTLSPKWNTIWPTSAAGPYADLTTFNAAGAPKLRKIAVLMTDGDYNVQYSGTGSGPQATTLCQKMKDAKIEIYTIGFQVSSAAATLLQGCATDASHFYNASSGEALKQAFRDIALKVSSLRLSQ